MFSPKTYQAIDFFKLQQRIEKLEKEKIEECLNYEAQNLKQERGEKDGD